VAVLLLVLADFLDPGRGPEQSGDFEVSPGFFIGLFGIGFLLAVSGHVFRSRILVGAGVLMIFLATVLIPIFLHATR
jgi:hypothetical protein